MTPPLNPLPSRAEFYEHLLVQRHSEAIDPQAPISLLAATIGAEAVVRTMDVIDGFTTPDATESQLKLFALHRLLQNEAIRNTWVTIG